MRPPSSSGVTGPWRPVTTSRPGTRSCASATCRPASATRHDISCDCRRMPRGWSRSSRGAKRLPGWAAAVARSVPDLWRRHPVEVRADGWVVHRGPIELLVVGTTPFYGRGLKVNPGARPDAGRLSLRVYSGPAPRLGLEAGRWALGVRPRAPRIDATEVTVRVLDTEGIPLQADGDLIGSSTEWRFGLRAKGGGGIGRGG